MRRLIWLAVGVGVVAVGLVWAGSGGMSKGTLWIVPYDCEETVRVQAGDMIELWTEPLSVIPENLESRFRASKVGQGVELVGETLPHREDTMERLYFFKAFEPGPATLKVELLDMDGTVRETRAYHVEVLESTCGD